jgi:hypothetical protein
MNFLTKTFGIGLVIAALFAGTAAAATLAVGSKSLSAGSATVSSCGISSLVATRTVNNSGNVTQVNVVGIPTACSGETLSITLRGAANVSLGGGTATIGSCTTSCSASLTSFGGTVSATSTVGYSFGVVGA